MTPFRSPPEAGRAPLVATDAVHDAVGQMVRQFADPMAFLRELVQNSLDADAREITVRLEHDRGTDTTHVSVRDDGTGMDQDVIERSLLVLFRSTKEDDPSKIGKFGVGFFSVFAMQPEVVLVDTGTRGNSEGLRLTLRPDFTWEIESIAPRRGTVVTLVLPRVADGFERFIERTLDALRRWCPHVSVPLLVEWDARIERIDRPFALDGEVCVTVTQQKARHALAVSPDGTSRYFNRGILLHEERVSIAPGVRWMVDAPDLHHTVSRDDVRRDAAQQRRVAQGRELAAGALRRALVERIAALAGDPAARAKWATLVARAKDFALRPDEIAWPLADTVRGATIASWDRGIIPRTRWWCATRSPLTEALARADIAVAELGHGEPERVFTACYDERAVDVTSRYTFVKRADDRDDPLHDVLQRMGAAIGLRAVWFADAWGRAASELALFVDARQDEALHDDAPTALRAPRKGRTLALVRSHRAVIAARRAAAGDPLLAALALLRFATGSDARHEEDTERALWHEAMFGS